MTRRNYRDFGDSLPFLINRVGSALAAGFAQEALDAAGLSIPMWRVLAALATHGQQRQTDLSDLTSIDRSTLSRLVSRIIRLGLVERSRSTKSSREVSVRLLPKGRQVVDRLRPVAFRYETMAADGLPAKEIERLKRYLRHMHQNIERTHQGE